jgi:hypothetical protein
MRRLREMRREKGVGDEAVHTDSHEAGSDDTP